MSWLQSQLEQIDAILFDVGGVFFIPHHAVLRPILEDLDVAVPADDAFHRAHYEGVRHDSGDHDDDAFWVAYNRRYIDALDVAERHRRTAATALREVWLSGMPLWTWRQDAAAASLRAIAQHVRIGIVSNADGTVETMLREAHVCQVGPGEGVGVEVIVDSTIVGVSKPNPQIFSYALDPMGLDPDRVLYVGDTYRYDVVGATTAGIKAVLLDPYSLHSEADHATVRDLDTLASAFAAR